MDVDEALADGGANLRAAVDAAARDAAGEINWPVDDPSPEVAAAAQRAGLSPARELFQLRVRLPLAADRGERAPVITEGLRLRAFRPGTGDETEWVQLNNAAFADHPDQGRQTLATLHAQMAEPWFDAAGFLLLEKFGPEPGRAPQAPHLLGFCWTKLHPATGTEPVLGEIYVIGVAPGARGRSLGLALVVAGLDYLAQRGARAGMLYVDADNGPALALYERLGFTRHHTRRVFSC